MYSSFIYHFIWLFPSAASTVAFTQRPRARFWIQEWSWTPKCPRQPRSLYIFESKIPTDITHTSIELDRLDCEEWKVEINCVPKLRTYGLFKGEYHVESYIKQIISKTYRVVLAQFRRGILPLNMLKVETGRFSNTPLARRLCEFCSSNSIEDETNFLLHCDH